tara:strand:- start:267 stop:494 length:228 start_codon:yes stop_codon:yes gene_type:complete
MIDGRLKYLSKDKEQRIQQLHLMIHNCSVYRVKESIKKVYKNELFKIENMNDGIYEEYINNVDSKFPNDTEFLTW